MPPSLAEGTQISFKQDNPKKKGSKAHTRYEQYKAAKTVKEALQLGAVAGDIGNDHKAGFLTVVGEVACAAQAVPSPKANKSKRTVHQETADGPKNACISSAPSPVKKRQKTEAEEAEPSALAPLVSNVAADLSICQAPPLAPSAPAASSSAAAPAEPPPMLVEAPAANPSEASSSAEQPTVAVEAAQPHAAATVVQEVDLSFATFEGRSNGKFIKRALGEAKKLLSAKGLAEAQTSKYEFTLLDRDSLSKWKVRLFDLNPEGTLAKQLVAKGLEPSIDFEISLPENFPLEPPFVRVLYPHLAGGFIFDHGGICFELLTPKGWAASTNLPSVVIAIQGLMDSGDVRLRGNGGDSVTRTVPQFTEAGARQDTKHINSVHKGGEARTYGTRVMNS